MAITVLVNAHIVRARLYRIAAATADSFTCHTDVSKGLHYWLSEMILANIIICGMIGSSINPALTQHQPCPGHPGLLSGLDYIHLVRIVSSAPAVLFLDPGAASRTLVTTTT
jgi:hypothetical protein